MSLKESNYKFSMNPQQIVEITEEDPREEEFKAPSNSMPVSIKNSPRGITNLNRNGENALLGDSGMKGGQP